MSAPDIERLRSIKSFPSLVKYLRDELEWPIESEDFDELTFEYAPEELGLDAKTAVKVKEIKQLRPLVTNQPWGIFFINFEPKRLPVVVLRRILRALILKKHQSANKPQQAAWNLHDLLFISSYGESDHRDITFAHFAEEDGTGDLPTLRVLGWDDEDTVLHLADADKKLKEKLHWPDDTRRIEEWRKQWSSTFTLRPREVIGTAKALAERLAEVATAIRKRVNKVLAIESESGALRKLMTAFREALIHDLKEDDFADMYAQTITYGMLTARVSRPAGLVAENVTDMVPITNPFLRDMLSTFLTVGGRKGKIDFDELGINEVVQALRDADMEAVLRDFGDKNPQEDPVIHFYEDFLKAYDPVKRTKRGVFYTPRPVVSFIVRSVDEILRKEFGLEDGLADTATWGEMAQRHKDLNIPNGVSPKEPFVQILDPACGTGTFLVEVIDVIYQTMRAKWLKSGHMPLELQNLWSEYVSEHLLPRLYGFELMMAPYAIAHMKLGLKLHETGYNFRSHERARIYLTNTLEEPKDFSDRFEFDAPALAHEAHAVNAVKRQRRFTVVTGNPPYAGISSNMTEHAQHIVDAYKIVDGAALNERKLWLQDDYVKFIRIAQTNLEQARIGILGYITNHGYLDNPTFRGMRQSLSCTFQHVSVLDLHGNANKKEQCPDGSEDKNVFDIRQGVAICLASRLSAKPSVQHANLWGTRESKYDWLSAHSLGDTPFATVSPDSPYYFFEPQNTDCRAEYDKGWKITDGMPVNSAGFITARDHFVLAFDQNELLTRIADFANSRLSDAEIRTKYFSGCGSDKYPDGDTRGWKVPEARRTVEKDKQWRERIHRCLYRPFDTRYVYWADWMVDWPRPEVMGQMLAGPNRSILTARSNKASGTDHFFCSRWISETKCAEYSTQSAVFPLYIFRHAEAGQHGFALGSDQQPNFSQEFLRALASALGVPQTKPHGLPQDFTPEDIFHYAYGLFHSPAYRNRYAEFLKIDFPRLPLTSDVNLFRALSGEGADLVALHLLEDDYPAASWNVSKPKGKSPLQNLITKFSGKGDDEIAKGHPKYAAGKVFINPTRWFEGVPENVWDFHIGGYQVCNKWLKDRRGRTLSDEDTTHYQRVVVALKETIRLMAEIDKVIDARGGWPGAFVTKSENNSQ